MIDRSVTKGMYGENVSKEEEFDQYSRKFKTELRAFQIEILFVFENL